MYRGIVCVHVLQYEYEYIAGACTNGGTNKIHYLLRSSAMLFSYQTRGLVTKVGVYLAQVGSK